MRPPAATRARAVVALTLLLPVTGCSAGAEPAPARPVATVQTTSGLSTDHRSGPLDYPTDPPLGGAHNAAWLACGAYDIEVPRELAVHSLEHGAVWLAHRPDLSPARTEQLTALRELSETTREYVLVSPYPGLRAPVVAVAWGASLDGQASGGPRLREFVESYAGGGQGGEKGAPCATDGLTPDQGRQLVAQQGGEGQNGDGQNGDGQNGDGEAAP